MSNTKKWLLILFGNLCVAIGTVFFIVPGGFITGGATGIALAFEAFWGLPISLGIAIVSITLLLVGWLFLGKEFAAGSALSAISYPIFVTICELIVPIINITTDSDVINLAGSILFYGYGIALVMRQGASTGGVDTIAIILNRKRGWSLSALVNLFEFLTMLTQLSYSTTEGIMGGILVTVCYTYLMNHLITQGNSRIQVMIYSDRYEEICRYIDTVLDRGCTLFCVQGGYQRKDKFAVQTIIHYRDLFRLKKNVKEVDPEAFLIVSEVSEVGGRGFSLQKKDVAKE